VIVDQLRESAAGDRVERSARLRWVGGEFRLRIEAPAGFAPAPEDATAYLPVALMLSMYRGEDLQIEGAVSPRLLRASEELQRVYSAWDPAARRCRVRAAAVLEGTEPAEGIGCMMSRGVDSMHAATRRRDDPLTHLVFCDSLEPVWGEDVRARERELNAEAARRSGLPLLVLSTNLRDPAAQLIDYNDLHGAGLALLAHSLSGGLGRCVFPAGGTSAALSSSGSHPLLDPLFSTERLEVEPASPWLDRGQRIRDLAAEAPELLELIKSCNRVDSTDNCGRCRKCLRTMIALHVAGVLDRVPTFPDRIDPELVRSIRLEDILLRHFWLQAFHMLGDDDAELRDAVAHMLRRSARPGLRERGTAVVSWVRGDRPWPEPRRSQGPSLIGRVDTNVHVALLVDGRPEKFGLEAATPQPQPAWEVGPTPPDWLPPPDPRPGLIGLVRLIDRGARRHRYAVGQLPPMAHAERVGELGALAAEQGPGSTPAWLTEDGRLVTEAAPWGGSERSPEATARWVLGPLRWRGVAADRVHVVELLRRLGEAVGPATKSPRPTGEPAGWLLPASESRLPLFSAAHPVTGDQLLSTTDAEAGRLGYGEPVLLGHLEAAAPMSGRLGAGRPFVPWASRFGQA
jgi:hypothetical protein